MSSSTVTSGRDINAEETTEGPERSTEALFQGVDLSGSTVVLGVGTGRLIALLAQQIADAEGNLMVVAHSKKALADLRAYLNASSVTAPVAMILARTREIPVLSETVDLLVVNGVLREVPAGKLFAISEEFWRVLVPGGQLRVSDVIEPCDEEHTQTWAQRNRIVRKLGKALEKPTALSVDLERAATALRSAGFEDLTLVLLPGLFLTDAWIEETINALRAMAGRLVDRELRDEILNLDTNRILTTYAEGNQRAAERFVLRGSKVGDLALDMEAAVEPVPAD